MDDKKVKPILGKEGPFSPKNKTSSESPAELGGLKPAPAILSGTPGALYISMTPPPSVEKTSRPSSVSPHYLNLFLTGDEWYALFFDVLRCPEEVPESSTPDDDWRDDYSVKFMQAIPDYPLLGQMWDIFNYVSYEPQEIGQLREECLRVQGRTSNETALKGLAKLIVACDEANKAGYGLVFEPE